jgi:hypothetical protein
MNFTSVEGATVHDPRTKKQIGKQNKFTTLFLMPFVNNNNNNNKTTSWTVDI